MTDQELRDACAAEPGGELWAVVAIDRALEETGVIGVMRIKAAAMSLVRRAVLTKRFGGAWVEHVPPLPHVLRGEVSL